MEPLTDTKSTVFCHRVKVGKFVQNFQKLSDTRKGCTVFEGGGGHAGLVLADSMFMTFVWCLDAEQEKVLRPYHPFAALI